MKEVVATVTYLNICLYIVNVMELANIVVFHFFPRLFFILLSTSLFWLSIIRPSTVQSQSLKGFQSQHIFSSPQLWTLTNTRNNQKDTDFSHSIKSICSKSHCLLLSFFLFFFFFSYWLLVSSSFDVFPLLTSIPIISLTTVSDINKQMHLSS